MANTTENDDKKKKKPLTLSKPGKLELKKTVEGGQVRQSFSHGRTKTVAVEVKKKRTFQQGSTGEMTEVKEAAAEAAAEAPQQPAETPAEDTGLRGHHATSLFESLRRPSRASSFWKRSGRML